jgi:hypothetical protein
MYFRPHRTRACNYMHICVYEWRNACIILFRCWEEFYIRDAKEAISENKLEPRGKSMLTHCFVNANHAGVTETRQSQAGILLFCNKVRTMWFSKRHNSVEASTFGWEFTAMKNMVEMVEEALRYKLRMFGVPIEGPTNVFCDNEAVCKNTSPPESTLTKKDHSIAYTTKAERRLLQGQSGFPRRTL